MTLHATLKSLAEVATPGPWRADGTDLIDVDDSLIASVWEADCDDEQSDNARLIVALRNALPTILAALEAYEWRPIEEAPKDGTPIIAWCVHPYASSMTQPDDYVGPVVARWIDHNGGGWTWHGHLGNFTHFRPLPSPPVGEG